MQFHRGSSWFVIIRRGSCRDSTVVVHVMVQCCGSNVMVQCHGSVSWFKSIRGGSWWFNRGGLWWFCGGS